MVTVSTFGQLYDAMGRNEREIKANVIYNEAEWKKINSSKELSASELRGMNFLIVLEALGCVTNTKYGIFALHFRLLDRLFNRKMVTRVFPMCKEYLKCYKVKEVSESTPSPFVIFVRK